jgi:diguanylate cyclase (GGDEF)-like protein
MSQGEAAMLPKNLVWKWRAKPRVLRAWQGAILSLGAPLGWLGLQAVGGYAPLEQIQFMPYLYLYLLVPTLLAFSIFGYVIGRHEELLEEISITDPLTGLRNQRYFRMRLEEEYATSQRLRRPLSLMMLDLDYFKAINDTHGHAAGDRMLAAAAQAMLAATRKGETAARIGGEEFAIILPGLHGTEALKAAERVRKAVKAVVLHMPGSTDITVTVSIGLHNPRFLPPEGHEELILSADQNLYAAKMRGRDQVAADCEEG